MLESLLVFIVICIKTHSSLSIHFRILVKSYVSLRESFLFLFQWKYLFLLQKHLQARAAFEQCI